MNLKETTQVYSNAADILETGIELHYVTSSEHVAFQKAFVALAETITKSGAGSPWDEYVKLLRRINWLFVCSPVAFSTILETRRDTLDVLNERIKATHFPEVKKAYDALVKCAKSLKDAGCNLLGNAVKDCFENEDGSLNVLMIVPERTLIQPARAALGAIADKWIICEPSAARHCAPHDCVVFFGPPWFLIRGGHGHILRSPLGKRMITFCMSSFRANEIAPSSLNSDSKAAVSFCYWNPIVGGEAVANSQADILLPAQRDWSTLLSGVSHNHASKDEEDITAECRAFVLGGSHMVFLDVDSKRWSLSGVRTKCDYTCTGINRTKTESLEPGDLIVLTTDGSGDMLKRYADESLGDEAEKVNTLQTVWKQALYDHVRTDGMAATVEALKARGSAMASPVNVRNWYSVTHIAMDNVERDLGAVLNLIDWDSKKTEVFRAVSMVRRARKDAALLLHRKLLERLQGQNISEVLQCGFMEFRLEEGDVGPSKTVFVIEEIGKDIVTMPSHRVNRVHSFDSEEA